MCNIGQKERRRVRSRDHLLCVPRDRRSRPRTTWRQRSCQWRARVPVWQPKMRFAPPSSQYRLDNIPHLPAPSRDTVSRAQRQTTPTARRAHSLKRTQVAGSRWLQPWLASRRIWCIWFVFPHCACVLNRSLFPDRDCFSLVRPMNDETQLANLDNVPRSQLRPEFSNVRPYSFRSALPHNHDARKAAPLNSTFTCLPQPWLVCPYAFMCRV